MGGVHRPHRLFVADTARTAAMHMVDVRDASSNRRLQSVEFDIHKVQMLSPEIGNEFEACISALLIYPSAVLLCELRADLKHFVVATRSAAEVRETPP